MGDEGVKTIQPFLKRAEEVSKKYPKIAYYCKLHAVEEGLRIPKRSEELMSLIKRLMGELEADKPKLNLADKKADQEYCEAFAVQVFKRADEADRAGKADLQTARSFYAASFFLDVLNHFGPLDEDLTAKQKYSVWKAADIRKALKEGRRPAAGSPSDVKILLRPGAKVLFAAEPTDPPAQGTIAKVEMIDGVQVYTVALKDTFVQAPVGCLALEVAAGDQVMYVGDSCETRATVQSMDVGHWPPSYVLALENGSVKDTGPDRVCLPPPATREQEAPGPCSDPPPSPVVPQQDVPFHQPYPPTVNNSSPVAEAAAPTQPPVYAPSAAPPTSSSIAAPPTAADSYQKSGNTQAASQPFVPDYARVMAAKKHAKSAASCLDFDDVPTSVKLLTEALRLLTDSS